MKKRILSVFVAAALCLGLLPTAALAAGSAALEDVTPYAMEGETLTLSHGTSAGDLASDGYHWDGDTNTLTLADGFQAAKVTIPDGKVTVETQGEATIGTLTTPDDGYGNTNPQNTKLTFSDSGTLTLQERLELSGGNNNALTVDADTTVIAQKGIAGGASGVDFPVTVNGHLTVYSDDTGAAIYAGKVAIGNFGVLEVSGKEGVFLNGMSDPNSIYRDFTNVFTVEGDGRFTANCEDYNIMAGGSAISPDLEAADAFPLGEDYLPGDCRVERNNNPDNPEINFIQISTGDVFSGPMTIHKKHTWGNYWKHDSTRHWQECTFQGCGERTNEGDHVYSDDQDTTCNTCGYTRTVAPSHSHVWSAAWNHDNSHHWHECTVPDCGITANSQKDGYGTHVYDDEQDTTCNTCGYTRTVAPPHDHTWSAAWSHDSGYHWHECTFPYCGLTDNRQKGGYGAHVYDDEQDTTCNTCSYVRTVTAQPDLPLSPSSSDSSGGRKPGSVSTYRVVVEQTDHGEVVSDRDRASTGSTVILTVVPDNGYTLGTLTVTDAQGREIRLTEQDDGHYAFTMPASDVTATAAFAPLPVGETDCPSRAFSDLDTGEWYHEAIDFVLARGLMSGTNAGFAPNAPLSRAMLAQILWNHAGKPTAAARSTFPDVSASEWYTGAIDWASENGIVSGYSDGRFGPNDSVTREQLAAILWRYAGSPAASAALSFTDEGKVSGYALDAMSWAAEKGIISGSGGQLSPQSLATRAQAAQMLMNLLKDS